MLPAGKAVLPPPPGSALHTELPGAPGSRLQLRAGAVGAAAKTERGGAPGSGGEGGGREEDGDLGVPVPSGPGGLGVRGGGTLGGGEG